MDLNITTIISPNKLPIIEEINRAATEKQPRMQAVRAGIYLRNQPMTQVSCKTMINAPAGVIWQVISDFGEAGKILSGIVTCSVDGKGIGALRTLMSADGGTIQERLEALDEAVNRLSYSLLTDTPFSNCLTSMEVRSLAPNQAELEWSATFEQDGIPESEAGQMLASALSANCLALKQYIENLP